MRPEHAEALRWLAKAANDASAARKLLDLGGTEFDVICFHCQQAIEKCLKALLVYHGRPFEKIHDLRRLLDQCAEADESIESIRAAVEPISVFAVAFRYPVPAEPTRSHAQSACNAMLIAWGFVAARVPGVVPSPPGPTAS